MDELRDLLVNLKLDSKVLRMLVDKILDCSSLKGDDLTISDDTEIYTIIRAFYPDEYVNRVDDLKSKRSKDNG